MDIECKLKRDGGSKVPLGGITYHFTPRSDGAHVADVKNDDHVDRFLSIPEAYRVYRGNAEPLVTELKSTSGDVLKVKIGDSGEVKGFDIQHDPEPAHVGLKTSEQHPKTLTIGGANYSLEEITAKAAEGIDPAAWNSLSDDDRADQIDKVLDDMASAAKGAPVQEPAPESNHVVLATANMALSDQYFVKFGKKPHHKWSQEKLAEELAKDVVKD